VVRAVLTLAASLALTHAANAQTVPVPRPSQAAGTNPDSGTTAETPRAPDPQGGIVVEQLRPLQPAKASPDQESAEGRFKPAPFRTEAVPRARELIATVETVPEAGARLRQLDKMTGRTQTFEIPAGSEKQVDRLKIRVETCRAPAEGAQHGTMAFLQINDTKHPGAAPAFSGWMFAESPALSALDHPRYDVWVLSCTTSSGVAVKSSE